MEDMHKREMIRRVAEQCGVRPFVVEAVLAATLDTLVTSLAAGQAVVWTGLGRFEMVRREERPGINPRTGAPITIAARENPRCEIGVTFRNRIDAMRGEASVSAVG